MKNYHYLYSGYSPHLCPRFWFKALLPEFGIIRIMSSKPGPGSGDVFEIGRAKTQHYYERTKRDMDNQNGHNSYEVQFEIS